RDAARVARQNPRTADFTRNILQRALKEIVACFPVYRTYVDGAAQPTEADRRDIDWAAAHARRNETDIDPSVFDFLNRFLTTDLVAQPRSGFSRQSVVRFAMRVQQSSGPVMAKGLEDTALYRYNRFGALNEVGGHANHFGVTLAALHRANAQRAERWPHPMLGFVRDALDTARPNAFLSAFLPFQEHVARLGIRNSLVQTALKLTLPGMPDIYQGAELWDLSLVDPDNRSPVDYRTRIDLLQQIAALLKQNRRTAIR